uniref:ORF1 protein n=1 Tax=Prochlorothrix hollandica TaxID=1223 RepID=Q05574_PROHO|nr:ORF1 [Prochlorothrix hollandica]
MLASVSGVRHRTLGTGILCYRGFLGNFA